MPRGRRRKAIAMQDKTQIKAEWNVTGVTVDQPSTPMIADDTATSSTTMANREPSPWWSIGLTVAAGAGRLLSPIPNFTPVGAMGLFGGGRLRGWQAYVLPILIMLATDAVLVFRYAPMKISAINGVTPFVYASFLLYVLLGRWLCRKNCVAGIVIASLLGSVQFFLVTNFAVWLLSDGVRYPHTLSGLGLCYLAGLPFANWTVFGDLLFTGVLFGTYALIAHLSAEPSKRLAS